jgi:hypothetical protein
MATPSPFIPLPLDKGKGEGFYKRGFASLILSLIVFSPQLDSPYSIYSLEGEEEEVSERGRAPLLASPHSIC